MKTKIIATVGPATQSPEMLKELEKEGVSVFRLNMSHGTVGWNESMVQLIHENTSAKVLLDTKGPEIRTCHVEHDVHVTKGETIIIADERHNPHEFDPLQCILVTYEKIASIVKNGMKIIIDSGSVILEVEKIENGVVWTKVLRPGVITSRRHVNIPGAYIDLPILTDMDEKNLLMGIKQGFDKVAVSFTRHAEDVRQVRQFLAKHGGKAIIVAKIENQEALENIDEIIAEADEIMIARGDLGVEIMWYEVPHREFEILEKCKKAGRQVIVATEMMTSMKESPRPTRAEVMDVTIAVKSGANFVMLSDETTVGKFPAQTVKAMRQIAEYTESQM